MFFIKQFAFFSFPQNVLPCVTKPIIVCHTISWHSPAIISIYPLYRSIYKFLRYFVHALFTDCLHYQPGQGIFSLSILLKISVKACDKYTFMDNLNNLNKFITYFQEK